MINNNESSLKDGKSVTIAGALINTLLIILKFVGGILGHSQALIADAVHSISDLFTDAVVLIGIRVGRKAPDENHPFGHARLETLASAFVGIALLSTAIYLGIDASLNIYNHTEHQPTKLALFAAIISIGLKEGLYHFTIRIGQKIKSQLLQANAWHHPSDALSSVAVVMGVSAAMINPSWHIFDSFAALIVSFFIIKVGLEVLGKCLKEFTDTAPTPGVKNKIASCAMDVKGVQNVHDLRIRTSGGLYQIEIHIIVDGNLTVNEGHRVAKEVEKCLTDDIEDFERAIVHVDPAVPNKTYQS